MSHALHQLLIRFAYEGHGFHGLQPQTGLPTAGGALVQRIERACGTTSLRALSFAARTDAGVHADVNWASCRVALTHDALPTALRAIAHADADGLTQVRAWRLPMRTLARAVAVEKTYQYTLEGACRAPGNAAETQSWQVVPALDVGAMQRAAAAFVGTHDFSAYTSGKAEGGRVKSVSDVTVQAATDAPQRIKVTITGTGFLRYMVRSMAGHLACVGAGLEPTTSVHTRLDSRLVSRWAIRAPAGGLRLVHVELATDIRRLVELR